VTLRRKQPARPEKTNCGSRLLGDYDVPAVSNGTGLGSKRRTVSADRAGGSFPLDGLGTLRRKQPARPEKTNCGSRLPGDYDVPAASSGAGLGPKKRTVVRVCLATLL